MVRGGTSELSGDLIFNLTMTGLQFFQMSR